MIYLSHFLHGFKIATLEMEAKHDEKNGWVRYTPDTPSVEPEEPTSVNALEVKRKYIRKVVIEGV